MAESSAGHLVGVLTSPEKTFQALRERPAWVVALVVLILLSTAANWLASQKVDAEDLVRTSIEQRGQDVDEDQLQQMIDFQEKFGTTMFVGGTLVAGPVIYLLVALICWVVFKLVGGEWSYKHAFSMVLHSFVPWAVAALLTIPVVMSRSEITATDLQGGNLLPSSLALLAGEDSSQVLKTFLGSFDLFSIWSLFLLATGASIMARIPRGTAITATVVLWAVYILAKVGWVAIWT